MTKRKAKLTKFGTGLGTDDYHLFPKPPYRGKTWSVCFGPLRPELGGRHDGDRIYPVREIVILARNSLNAQRAANLIHSAYLALEGSAFLGGLYPGESAPISELKEKPKKDKSDCDVYENQFRLRTSHLPLACMVAARASFRVAFVYSLAKLRQSLDTISVPLIELDPLHSPTIPKSPLREDHVRLSAAIFAAWSCIEELGFKVPADSKNPSRMPDGAWNPVVKAKFEATLRRGHINLNERFYWSARGKLTNIDKKRPPLIAKKAKWARYDIRDGEMEVIDAINQVSFLRSWVTAHKSDKKMLRVLSVYDVANAQFLARRLLLERLRYWRYLGKD